MTQISIEEWHSIINYFRDILHIPRYLGKERYKYCVYCGGAAIADLLRSGDKYLNCKGERVDIQQHLYITKDHLIPLSKNGKDMVGNIVPACYVCNQEKGNDNVLAWYLFYKYFQAERFQAITNYLKLYGVVKEEDMLVQRTDSLDDTELDYVDFLSSKGLSQ